MANQRLTFYNHLKRMGRDRIAEKLFYQEENVDLVDHGDIENSRTGIMKMEIDDSNGLEESS